MREQETTNMTAATITLEEIRDQIRAGRLDEAREALKDIREPGENDGERLFIQGYLLERSYDREGALAAYEAALEKDPDHAEAAFRAALLADQLGDDEAAVELYRQCTSRTPAPVNALINLAVLYEEREEYAEAEACLRDVLAEHPNHRRARQYLKSVESATTMFYDEQTQAERERRHAVLDMPISDFELSVRSRNCLRQMNIRTLADLLKTTEAELLSYKNFGETSLSEIKVLLAQKGLRLGQALQPAEPVSLRPAAATASPNVVSNAQRPVSELELSVRSRKALLRLGVTTLGELADRTEAELMSIKNFGETSLIEIKGQLAKYGLSFRTAGA